MPSGRRRGAALAGLALSAGLLSACGYQPVPPNRLELGNQQVYAHCAAPTKSRAWPDLQATPTEFGLDDLVIKGAKAITVTSVDLVPRSTRLTLVSVALLPLGGSVDSGFRFGDPRSITNKEAWDQREVLPATLTRLHPTQAITDEYGEGAAEWQVVVSVLPTGENDTADALAIHYTVGGRSAVLVGRHSFAIAKTQAQCNKITGG